MQRLRRIACKLRIFGAVGICRAKAPSTDRCKGKSRRCLCLELRELGRSWKRKRFSKREREGGRETERERERERYSYMWDVYIYIEMYVYTCIYAYVCVYIYMYLIHIYRCNIWCMYIYISLNMYIQIYVCRYFGALQFHTASPAWPEPLSSASDRRQPDFLPPEALAALSKLRRLFIKYRSFKT